MNHQDSSLTRGFFSKLLERVPNDMQLVLGTVSLHGADYDGYVIRTEDKYHLLSSDAYEEVSDLMKPYYAKLIQPSI